MAQRSSHVQALRLRLPSFVVVCLLCSAPAWSNVEIEIRGVDDELKQNVLAYLSFDRYRKSEALSVDAVERLHNRVEREVAAALKPFGYYEPKTHSELKDLGSGNWRVNVEIEPGQPVLLNNVEIRVTGPGAQDELFRHITANPPLHKGDRLRHAAYERVKNDLQRTASNYGYLDARMLKSELRVDPEKHTADATLELETGSRYRFGTTTIEQQVIRDSLVRRYMRYQQEDPFDMTEILRTQFALDDSQYFSTVEVLPGDPDRDEHIVPVSIHAAPNRRNRYSVGGGYGTDTDVRGTLQWEDRRINESGHRFNLQLQASTPQQSLESHYIIPIGDPALEKLAFETTYEQEQFADVKTDDYKFEPSITQVAGRWQWVYFVTAENVTTRSAVENQTDTLLIPGISVASVPRGYLGEALFSRGLFAQLRGSTHVLGSDSDFVQMDVRAERTFNIARRLHLLLRGEVGASLVGQFSNLPGNLRFFAGGDRSVRGFGYNELSPTQVVKDANGNPVLDSKGNEVTVKVGGRNLVTGTVEIERDLPRNFGVAAFFDFGNAFDHFTDPLEYSVGLGFRYRLPVLTLGIDIAQPISQPGAGPRLHINFSPKL
ncbi:MAG TPA: BamA/TamA family outer membrane protein [Steroidobacteraceae bacterium]|nr:BamA/TamA family outer membrane protein [Steroidobacteraceae bacterium]